MAGCATRRFKSAESHRLILVLEPFMLTPKACDEGFASRRDLKSRGCLRLDLAKPAAGGGTLDDGIEGRHSVRR